MDLQLFTYSLTVLLSVKCFWLKPDPQVSCLQPQTCSLPSLIPYCLDTLVSVLLGMSLHKHP